VSTRRGGADPESGGGTKGVDHGAAVTGLGYESGPSAAEVKGYDTHVYSVGGSESGRKGERRGEHSSGRGARASESPSAAVLRLSRLRCATFIRSRLSHVEGGDGGDGGSGLYVVGGCDQGLVLWPVRSLRTAPDEDGKQRYPYSSHVTSHRPLHRPVTYDGDDDDEDGYPLKHMESTDFFSTDRTARESRIPWSLRHSHGGSEGAGTGRARSDTVGSYLSGVTGYDGAGLDGMEYHPFMSKIKCLAVGSDNKLLAAGFGDGSIAVVDIIHGEDRSADDEPRRSSRYREALGRGHRSGVTAGREGAEEGNGLRYDDDAGVTFGRKHRWIKAHQVRMIYRV